MKDIWERIEKWLEINAPEVLLTLQYGASEAQIRAAEAYLSISFPEEVKESFRIHNGQISKAGGSLINGRKLLPLERIKKEWEGWRSILESGDFEDLESNPDNGVRAGWWNEGWMPLTYDGGGNHDCVDLRPAEGGKVGQIISVCHDNGSRKVVASGISSWLDQFADDLESGIYIFSEEHKGLMKVDAYG